MNVCARGTVAILMFLVLGIAAPAWSERRSADEGSYGRERTASERGGSGPARAYNAGTYWTTALSNVVYVPAKVALAATGAATSGVAYIVSFGNENVTRSIFEPSVKGDYFITPAMIEGRERVEFLG